MTLSAKTGFFAVVTVLVATVQPLFAAGHPAGGGGGGFSRPAMSMPAAVNRSLPARSSGNSQTFNPVARNGNSSSSRLGNGNPSATTSNSTKLKANSDNVPKFNRLPADSNRVPAKLDKVPRAQPSDGDRHLAPTSSAADSSAPVETRHTKPSDPDAPPVITPDHSTPVQTAPRVITPDHSTTPPTTGTPVHTTPDHSTTPPTTGTPVHTTPDHSTTPPTTTPDHSTAPPAAGTPVHTTPVHSAPPAAGTPVHATPVHSAPQPTKGSPVHTSPVRNNPASGTISPLPGEHGTPVRLPSRGISNPGSGIGIGGNNGLGDLLGQLPSLLSGAGGSGMGGSDAAASGADESAPAEAAAPATDSVASSPAQATPAPTKDALDVELIAVRLVEEGSLSRKTGPRYRLFYRNAGNVEVPRFHATVAVDIGEKVTEKAEVVTVEAVGLKPGKTQTVDVRLPVEVLTMGIDYEGHPAAFNALVALIDSDDDLAETNEENNILVLSRDKIQSIK